MQKQLTFRGNIYKIGIDKIKIFENLKNYVKNKYDDKYYWHSFFSDGNYIDFIFKLKKQKKKYFF